MGLKKQKTYYMKRETFGEYKRSPYFRTRNSNKSLGIFKRITFLIVFGVIALGGYLFFASPWFTLNTINVSIERTGNIVLQQASLQESEVQQFVQQFFNKNAWILFKESNFFIFNKHTLEEDMHDSFVFADISIHKKDFHTINIFMTFIRTKFFG